MTCKAASQAINLSLSARLEPPSLFRDCSIKLADFGLARTCVDGYVAEGAQLAVADLFFTVSFLMGVMKMRIYLK